LPEVLLEAYDLILPTVTAAAAGNHGNRVREKGHNASALDGDRDVMLMLRASASDAARLDLAAVGHILAKELSVLVINELDVLLAKLAVLATRLALKFLLLLLSHVFVAFLQTIR
jgi:MoxR-like ATPase